VGHSAPTVSANWFHVNSVASVRPCRLEPLWRPFSPHFARLYADEARLRAADRVERSALRENLVANEAVPAVLLIDDGRHRAIGGNRIARVERCNRRHRSRARHQSGLGGGRRIPCGMAARASGRRRATHGPGGALVRATRRREPPLWPQVQGVPRSRATRSRARAREDTGGIAREELATGVREPRTGRRVRAGVASNALVRALSRIGSR
jgi:hypothetical protein